MITMAVEQGLKRAPHQVAYAAKHGGTGQRQVFTVPDCTMTVVTVRVCPWTRLLQLKHC